MSRVTLIVLVALLSACGAISSEPKRQPAYSESYSGVLDLTESEPTIDLPIALTLDGEPAELLGSVEVEMQAVSFSGASSPSKSVTHGEPVGVTTTF